MNRRTFIVSGTAALTVAILTKSQTFGHIELLHPKILNLHYEILRKGAVDQMIETDSFFKHVQENDLICCRYYGIKWHRVNSHGIVYQLDGTHYFNLQVNKNFSHEELTAVRRHESHPKSLL